MKNLCLKLALVALVALLSVASPQTHAQVVICCVGPEPGVLFLVTSLDDRDDGACDADCTLREAITITNARAGADGIRFGVSGVINLGSPLPDISDDLTINGPGADLLTVRGRGPTHFGVFFGIFTVTAPSTATVTLANMTISNGVAPGPGSTEDEVPTEAGEGGGIFNRQATLNIINCKLSGNRALYYGGGVSNRGTMNVTNSTFSNNGGRVEAHISNDGGRGGGIFNLGTAQITNSTFTQNIAPLGGAIINDASSPSNPISRSGTLNVTNSTFANNGATSVAGAGIWNAGAINVSNSTFSNNSVPRGAGGGIFNWGYGNTVATAHIRNCTLTDNVAFSGGAMANAENTAFFVTSTIIAGNRLFIDHHGAHGDGPDVASLFVAFTSGGFNLIGVTDGSTGFTAATDQTGTAASPLDPKLDPAGLQLNGGPTRTIALQPDSPAIDKGTANPFLIFPPNALITDQRGPGFRRTVDYPSVANAAGGDGTDIGAFEVQPTTEDLDGDGIPDNRDPDIVAEVIMTLPETDFNSPGNKNAFLRRLDEIELLILADDIDGAVEEWRNLRRHVDGCGAAARDTNDWITNCDSQLHVRALSDTLTANLLN